MDSRARTVNISGKDGRIVSWAPDKLAGRSGGVEVYRAQTIELREGDRIRWTRNNAELGLVNSQTAEVMAVRKGTVAFRLEDGRKLSLRDGDTQLRHIDRAWASTVHAFQGRTVDTVIAAMEANQPHLTTQKTLYVEISRARHWAELVTDDRDALRERLEAVTGERISALEGVGADRGKTQELAAEGDLGPERQANETVSREPTPEPEIARKRAPRDLGMGM